MTEQDQIPTLIPVGAIVEKASQYAIERHRAVNQYYGEHPYEFHLRMVVKTAYKFKHLIPDEELDNVIAGAWVHDIIEDCRETYNDVKHATNETVAELAYALTNEKGRNRKERASDKYYQGIRETPYAAYIKICDRIANAEHSVNTGSSMVKAYRRENENFEKQLYHPRYEEMFAYLRKLLEEKPKR